MLYNLPHVMQWVRARTRASTGGLTPSLDPARLHGCLLMTETPGATKGLVLSSHSRAAGQMT